jgi:hypothetical protein
MSAIYPKFKQALMTGAANSDLDGTEGDDGVYAAMIDTGTYTYSAAHEFYSDLSGIVGTPVEVLNKTQTSGVFDGDNVTFTAFSGSSVEAVVLYRKNSGANTTWRLVAYIDSATGLPLTPSGADLEIRWNASGIFSL